MHKGWNLNNYSWGGVTLAVWTRQMSWGAEFEVCDEENIHRLSGEGYPSLDVLEGIAREIIEEQRQGVQQ